MTRFSTRFGAELMYITMRIAILKLSVSIQSYLWFGELQASESVREAIFIADTLNYELADI